MKLQQFKTKGNSFWLVLPKQLILAKGWKKGDELKASIDDKVNIIIKKIN